MSTVDDLLRQYIAEQRAGSAPDPHVYLERVEGAERAELAALIDGVLSRAPRAAWNREAFEQSAAKGIADSLARSLGGVSGLWPSLLPRLRHEARMKRAELVRTLAERLGFPADEERVGEYYHRMETGQLPPAGVSQRVLEALGSILGETADALREAGRTIAPSGPGAIPDVTFARTASPDPGWGEPAMGPPDDEPQTRAAAMPNGSGREPDELDRLFLAG